MSKQYRDEPETLAGCLLAWIREFTGELKGLWSDLKAREQTPPDDPPDEPDYDRLNREFASELYTSLLLELPDYRDRLRTAWESNNLDELDRQLHQLLGCAAYCETPELSDALKRLRNALKNSEQKQVRAEYLRTLNVIDCTLRSIPYERNLDDIT